MKKIFFLIAGISVLLSFSMQIAAQERERRGPNNEREDFFAKRNAYITKKVDLTTEKAVVFIPLENELMRKKFEAGRDCSRLNRELSRKKEKSEDDYRKILDCNEKVKENREKLDKEYMEKFKKILSSEQILRYQRADMEFYNEFFRERRD